MKIYFACFVLNLNKDWGSDTGQFSHEGHTNLRIYKTHWCYWNVLKELKLPISQTYWEIIGNKFLIKYIFHCISEVNVIEYIYKVLNI